MDVAKRRQKSRLVRLFSTGIILLTKQYLKQAAVTLSAVKRGRGGADFTSKNANPLTPSLSRLSGERELFLFGIRVQVRPLAIPGGFGLFSRAGSCYKRME